MRVSLGVTMSAAAAASSLGSATSSADINNDAWASLREGIDAWRALDFDADFAVNVGTATGTEFLYSPDGFSMHTEMEGASLSKWPAAVMIAGLVEDGTMSFDDKANKYLDFWSTDESDPRSNVTLESLLSFTSGFEQDVAGIYECFQGDYLKCAESAYKETKKFAAPRTKFEYLSCHLQFAGAMAVAASGKTMQELFDKYLYKPFNMTGTSWSPLRVPALAVGIRTDGADFENFLRGMLTYSGISKETLDQVETDWTKAPVNPSGDGWFGHYGMGHWWECMGYGTPNERAELSPDCVAAHIQAGPGEYGFYPLLDRSGGGGAAGPMRPAHYFQVILQEPDALSGIPEYLRIITKPISDLILNGTDPASVSNQQLLSAGGGIIRRDIDYIQSELEDCSCSAAADATGEPFASLTKDLPKDDPQKNRRDILSEGGGLSLFDLAKIQKSLGKCTCSGRRKQHDKAPSLAKSVVKSQF